MKLQPRERKMILVAGVLALLVVGVYFVVVPLLSRGAASRDDFQLVQKELRRQKELIAAKKQIQDQAAVLQSRLSEMEHHLLPTEDPGKAGAELQAWVSQQAAQQQLDIVRSEFLPSTKMGTRYVRVPVQFELNGQITQLTQFFNALTGGERIIAVEDLQINSAGAKDKRVRCVVVVATLMATAS
jgi:Tfp pilus assembly protein PilO